MLKLLRSIFMFCAISSCASHPYYAGPVEIPIVIVFRTSVDRLGHEDYFIAQVEEMNTILEGTQVGFYVADVIEDDFPSNFDRSDETVERLHELGGAGAITIFVVDSLEVGDKVYVGYALSEGCSKVTAIKKGARPEVFAHEIGHLLGLPHSPDKENLMHYKVYNGILLRDQMDTIKYNAIHFYRKCSKSS